MKEIQENKPSQRLIEFIADSLANFHDWDVPELRMEFINVVLSENFEINAKLAELIFDEFMKIEPRIRFSPGFDHINFVTNLISMKFKNKESK